jgi:hypothetical protein
MAIYPLHLKNVHNVEIAVVHADKVEFIPDSPLKDSIACSGIIIPQDKWGEFNGRTVVHLKDPAFSKAFCEIYFPRCLKESGYTLEKPTI